MNGRPAPNGGGSKGSYDEHGRITRYEIRDEAGHVVAVHMREDLPDGDKRMWWEGPDGTRGLGGCAATHLPLYGVDELAKAPPGALVVVTEGEKARDALKERGILAVATVTGAKTTHNPEAFRPLLNRPTVLWPDNDDDGRHHTTLNADALHSIGHAAVRRLTWPEAPPKGDAFDFFDRGGTTEQARELIEASCLMASDRETVIHLNNLRLNEKTTKAINVLQETNNARTRIFYEGGVLVRLRLDDGAPRVEALSPDALRGALDRVAIWKRKKNIVEPPTGVIRDVLSLPSYDGFPRLRAVAEAPFFTAEGHLVIEPGYHREACTYLHLLPGLKVPPVPTWPSVDDVKRAARLFREDVYCDFPFVDEASRAHAIGLTLLPFIREMIDGPTPSHAVDAPMAGSGKGLLANLAALIATGRPIEVMSEAKDNDELRKRITSVLLGGTPIALFDNISHRLDSAVLSAALTAEMWADRVLGVSKMVRVPLRITWILTGNNLTFSREMARRTFHIRLDAKSPEPHLRAGFKHDPIAGWVRTLRGELVWAALVIVQNWIAQGRPPFTARRLGSYEAWSQVVGGVLEVAGVKGFLQNLSTFATRADVETAEWRRFLTAWYEKYGRSPVDTGALLPLAEAALPEVLGDASDRSQRIRLGKALAKRVGWTFKVTAGGRDLVLRITETEGQDADKRRRTAWALGETEEAQHIGTLGPASATQSEDCQNASPQCSARPIVLSRTLERVKAGADTNESAGRPNVPVLIDSPDHSGEDMAEWMG